MKNDKDAFEKFLFTSFATGAIDGTWHRMAANKYKETRPRSNRVVAGEGTTHWYVCDKCECAVDGRDNFCRGCGSRLDGE